MEGENPSPGDVLIVPASATGRGYTLSTAPAGPSQLWYPSYDEAVRKALEWATASGVSAWRTNGSAKFERVRSRES